MVKEQNEFLDSATLTLKNTLGKFRLYDFYGNTVVNNDNKIVIPLNRNGYFLRTDGSSGSLELLKQELKIADIKGIESLETIVYDFIPPLTNGAPLRIKLTNVLNRPISGKLKLDMKEL